LLFKLYRIECLIGVLAITISACVNTISPDVQGRNSRTTGDPAISSLITDERYDLALSLTEGGNLRPAIRLYQALAQDYPGDALPYLELGKLLLNYQAVDEAEQAFIAAAKRGAVTEARIGRGYVFLTRNKAKMAIEMFYPIFISNPNEYEAINGIGVAYDIMGYHRKAQEFYAAALQKKVNWRPALTNLSLSFALSGDYKKSIDILQRLNSSPVAIDKDRHNLALVYALAGNIEEFKNILSIDLLPSQIQENTKFIQEYTYLIPDFDVNQ